VPTHRYHSGVNPGTNSPWHPTFVHRRHWFAPGDSHPQRGLSVTAILAGSSGTADRAVPNVVAYRRSGFRQSCCRPARACTLPSDPATTSSQSSPGRTGGKCRDCRAPISARYPLVERAPQSFHRRALVLADHRRAAGARNYCLHCRLARLRCILCLAAVERPGLSPLIDIDNARCPTSSYRVSRSVSSSSACRPSLSDHERFPPSSDWVHSSDTFWLCSSPWGWGSERMSACSASILWTYYLSDAPAVEPPRLPDRWTLRPWHDDLPTGLAQDRDTRLVPGLTAGARNRCACRRSTSNGLSGSVLNGVTAAGRNG
jgi:hypothetical protein